MFKVVLYNQVPDFRKEKANWGRRACSQITQCLEHWCLPIRWVFEVVNESPGSSGHLFKLQNIKLYRNHEKLLSYPRPPICNASFL